MNTHEAILLTITQRVYNVPEDEYFMEQSILFVGFGIMIIVTAIYFLGKAIQDWYKKRRNEKVDMKEG